MFVSVLTVPLWSVGGGVKVVPRLIASSSAALVDAGRTLDCTLEKVATICKRLSISGPGPREENWATWEKDRTRWEQELESVWEDGESLFLIE